MREKLIDILKSDMITVFENGYSDQDIEDEVNALTDDEVKDFLNDFE